jgi:paraquat-inducible protein B
MSQPNTRTIGLFVLGAAALTVAGLVAFGSRSYFEHRPRAVTFFHGSVAGLVVGAPVTFRGVGVGSVVKISLQINSVNGTAQIPVIMEFEPERVTVAGGTGNPGFAERMMANGLGASLVMQSLITGQLAVELDYHDAAEETVTGINLGLPEIPEARGGLNAMKDTISRLPLQELADNAVSALRSLNELVSAPETHEILKYLDQAARSAATTTNAADQAIEHADALIAALQPQLITTVTSLNHLLANADQRTGQIAGDLHTTLGGADRTLAEGQAALGNVRMLVAPRSPAIQDAEDLLHNLAAAAASLRSFADQVERNPNALVMGRSR